MAAAAAATLAACFVWAVVHRRHAAATPAPIAPIARAVVAPAAPTPAPSVEAGPVAVVVESTPPGATVYAADGAALGDTPLALSLPRSTASTTLTLRKPGYAPGAYSVVADRAQTLRAALEPVQAPAHAARPRPAPGRESTSMTIDPFK
jgi:hypothetical protein